MKPLFLIAALLALPAYAVEGVAEATVSTSVTSAHNTTALEIGWKLVNCTAKTHYRMARTAALAVATTDDYAIQANTDRLLHVTVDLPWIGFVLDSSTGTCTITPLNVAANAQTVPPVVLAPTHPITDIGSVATFGANASVTVTAGTTCFCSPSGDAVIVCSLIGTTLFITLAASDGTVNYVCFA